MVSPSRDHFFLSGSERLREERQKENPMFDMSPEAIKRREDRAAFSSRCRRLPQMLANCKQVTKKQVLGEIYQAEFDAYLERTGLCPNCDEPMTFLNVSGCPDLKLPRCPCGCEKKLSDQEWVMVHWTENNGVKFPDNEVPLWWWLGCGREVGAILFRPSQL
jgi:hypothetical protein